MIARPLRPCVLRRAWGQLYPTRQARQQERVRLFFRRDGVRVWEEQRSFVTRGYLKARLEHDATQQSTTTHQPPQRTSATASRTTTDIESVGVLHRLSILPLDKVEDPHAAFSCHDRNSSLVWKSRKCSRGETAEGFNACGRMFSAGQRGLVHERTRRKWPQESLYFGTAEISIVLSA